jgi:AbiV family abortive infection protein
MRIFNEETLLVAIRKEYASTRPEVGEIFQSIVFSLINSQNNFEVASTLSEKNPTSAFSSFIGGLEEFGKFITLSSAIIEWKSDEKLKEFENKKTKHTWKLTTALEFLAKFKKSRAVKLSAEIITDKPQTHLQILNKLSEIFSPESAHKLHELRLKSMYVDFESKMATSPYHSMNEIDPIIIKILSAIFAGVFKNLINAVTQSIVPELFKLVNKVYYETNNNEIKITKIEINRQVNRILPSIRKVICEIQMKKENIYGVDWFNKHYDKIDQIKFDNTDLNAENIISKINNLVSGHDEIDLIYFYPPLKESAHKFYSDLIDSNKKQL